MDTNQGTKLSKMNKVIMSMENYESTMKQLTMYQDIEISERQIEAGQVKDARKALGEMRAKYSLRGSSEIKAG